MEKLKQQIEQLLNKYTEMKTELKMLQYELQQLTTTLPAETIEAKVFAHSNQEWTPGTHISDKTADIVVEHVSGQQDARYHTLNALIQHLSSDLHRLEYYISLLPEKESEIIRFFYLDKLQWSEITGKLSVTQRTLERRKKSGLDKLIHYYALLDSLGLDNSEQKKYPRFISYLHEERFIDCLQRVGKDLSPGATAMLYIISGCNELWNIGVDSFFDFSQKTPLDYTETVLSENSGRLLRFSCHLANSADISKANSLYKYIPSVEYVHLELAIEAIKLILFSPDN